METSRRVSDREIAALRAEVDTLKAEVEWRNGLLLASASHLPAEWRLAPMEGRLVGALMRAGPDRTLTRTQLVEAIYWDHEEPDDPEAVISVMVYKINKKLSRFGIIIMRHGWLGYRIVPSGKMIVRQRLEVEEAVARAMRR